ncbi:pirin family protein [Marinicella rhabdoformis]|uniref:pirin family protein n=1 Tax=Marinicella rhabdoformis TaxID=2580566 RepID=UPI0012AEBAE8|nr:pirin family protein [Marinicella rhabdoformis]
MNKYKTVDQVYQGIATSDGDGVKLTRIIGIPELKQLDPFLLLDAFGTDQPQDYIGGFPPHPHRGFETVTYMLEGRMRHKDSMGNEGVIGPGDVQWMSAASGVIHSEMPEQEGGLLAGFQLWVNLPQKDKMSPPKYQEFTQQEIPVEHQAGGISIKVITGATAKTQGPVNHQWRSEAQSHALNYWDVVVPQGQTLVESIPASHNGFVYVIDGEVQIGENSEFVKGGQLATLLNEYESNKYESNESVGNEPEDKGKAQQIKVKTNSDSRFLLVTGEPLNEPVVRAGPFVMSTHEDLKQAFKDHENGVLVS